MHSSADILWNRLRTRSRWGETDDMPARPGINALAVTVAIAVSGMTRLTG
ncbi:hypothetical protein [Parafrankia elaeagni]|nr:hypothetical protein [Parafrankia elaeagni]